MKWFCKHYVGCKIHETAIIHGIDADANLYSGNILNVENTLKKDIK